MAPSTSHACSNCQSPLRAGETFCGQCGTPVSAVGVAVAPPSDPGRDTPGSFPPGGGTFSWDAIVQRLKEITLGEYDILTELGRGGMAAVFLAHEFALNRKVALKVMSPAMMMGEGMIDRFYAEAVTQANLAHPHIVGVHAVRQEEDLHYFVMQYVPGRSLLQVLRAELAEGRVLSLAVIRSLVHQIGSALAFAHRRGVIHRDIKPANVLLNGDGDAVVTDFGIAKVAANPSQTMTGTVVGTAPYMSPEQCYASELTGASDQYSLGILLYELLTGAPPFSGNSFAVMQAHTLEEPPPLQARRRDCPPDLAAAVMRMLAKTRDARFPDIHAALVALDAKPASSDTHDPVRTELVRLSDVRGVEAGLTSVLHVPLSPVPRTRRQGDARRSTLPTPQRAVEAYVPPSEPTVPPPAERHAVLLRLSDPPARVEVGERIRLRVTGTDATGSLVEGLVLRWSSSNPAIARVAADTGEIDAVAQGDVDIIVAARDAVATTRLHIAEARIARVIVTAPDTIEVGESAPATAEMLDARGNRLERPVTWSSSDATVAVVSSAGVITARARGAVRVIAGAGQTRGDVELRVAAPSIARIEIGGIPQVIGPGEEMAATATLYDKHGRALGGRELAGQNVRWESSNPGVLSVSPAGACRAVRAGQARIAARCEDASASAEITVGLVPIARLDVEGFSSSLRVGASRRTNVRARDADGRTRQIAVQWSSADPEIATVDASGLVTARRAGETTLRVRCGTNERAFPLAVRYAVPLSVRLAGLWQRPFAKVVAGAAALGLVSVLVLLLVADAPDVAQAPVAAPAAEPPRLNPTPPPSTAVGNPSTANVPPAPAADPGTRVVAAAPVTGLSITGPRQHFVEAGEPLALRVSVPAEAGQAPTIAWMSADPAVASVDRTGRVTALAAGTTTISAAAGGLRDIVTVTVRPPTLARLEVAGVPATLAVGDSAQVSARAFSRGNRTMPAGDVTWRSTNAAVASVDPTSGWLRARSAGSAEIHADQGSVRSPGRPVTVQEAPRAEPGRPDPVPADPGPARAPAPSNVPSRASLIAYARESALACRDVYASRNADRIDALGRGGNQTEEANRAFVLQTIRNAANLAIASAGPAGDPILEGTEARVRFPMRATWRDNFRRDRSADLTLLAILERSGDGWTLTSCRIVERR